jgi:branched-chain amino acid aminotransferase
VPQSIPSNILLYGKGIFTTISFRDGELFLWEKHWRRLAADSAKIEIDISFHHEAAVKDAVVKAIRGQTTGKGRVRLSFLDESLTELWGAAGGQATSLSIVIGKMRQIPSDVRITVSPYLLNSTSPLAGIKSCNYLEHMMAFEQAKARGFDEAIRLNERGEVASACMANVFWSKAGKLYTPRLKTGCLAGTTREFILENIECEEVEAGEDAIREADEIFLTSAGIGVVQVAEFEGRIIARQPHKILDLVPKPI